MKNELPNTNELDYTLCTGPRSRSVELKNLFVRRLACPVFCCYIFSSDTFLQSVVLCLFDLSFVCECVSDPEKKIVRMDLSW